MHRIEKEGDAAESSDPLAPRGGRDAQEHSPARDDSDQPLERRIGELVREQALSRTREEVPHAIAVVVDEVKPPRGKHAGRVTATLIVEAESQQGILVGKDGATVRAIGTAARPGIEELVGGKVYLDLRVKVRKGWRRDDSLLERFGL